MNEKIIIGIILLGLLFVSGCVDEEPNILTKAIKGVDTNLTGDIVLIRRITTAPIEQFCNDIGMEYILPLEALARDYYEGIPRCVDKNNEMHFFMIDVDEDNLLWHIGNMTYEMNIEIETLDEKR